jgi:MoaA/NifB/PqqE/SkfB family radical SAM enzyme
VLELPNKHLVRIALQLGAVGAKAIASTAHPILVHLVVTRRCNLACVYCNEYDSVSAPVPTERLTQRIDLLAKLGTSIVSLTGGEPLLHPDLVALVRYIDRSGIFSELLTNGFLLSKNRIEALNHAGLKRLQISVDNLKPNAISTKSMRVLQRKLTHLAEHAQFQVNINSVLGSGVSNPGDVVSIAQHARSLGFTTTIGVIHDGKGQLAPLNRAERDAYAAVAALNSPLMGYLTRFKRNLINGQPNRWRCRAGARYLYICENGLVHRCSQQRGVPGIPLESYCSGHLAAEFDKAKMCAPYCTLSCAQTVALFDNWRRPQRGT